MKRFDLFGVPFLVNLRGRDKTNSNCGFLFTLILLVLSVLMFVYFSDDMINRKNPIVNRSEIKSAYIDDTLPMDTGSFLIKFGLTVSDSLTFYIDETIYTAVAKTFIGSDYLDETVDGCTNFFTLELDVCTSRWGTGQLYCLDTRIPDDMKKCLKDKTQENLFLIVNHQDIYIDFYKCTGHPNCQSLSYINQVLQSGYWVAEYNDWAVDTQNYKNPLNSFPRIVEYGIVANMYKRFVVNLGKIEFISDDGWLLNSPSTQEFLFMESTSMDFFVQENYKFFRLSLSSNGNKLQYSRTYDKIQDVIARVSSVFGICLVVIGAFALPMAKATMYETIVNDSYQVKIRSGEKNLMRLKTKKPSKRDRLYKKAATTSLKTTTNGDMLTSGRALKVRDELNGYLSDINSKFNDTPRENIPDANELENLPAICINRVERADSQNEEEQDDELTLQSEIPRRSAPVILPDVLDRMTTNKLEIERQKSTSSGKDSATNNSRFITSYAPSRFASSPLLAAPTRPMSPTSPMSPISPAHCELEFKQREEKQEFLEQTEQEQEEFITMPAEESASRPFQVTWIDWFKSLFMSNPRVSALEKGIMEINSHTDIRTIINMKRDIENLKCCVFSPQQHAIFDNLKKPALYVNTDEKSLNPCVIDVVNSTVSYRGNQRKLREAYCALRKSKGKDDLTKRLLFLYEQREGEQEKKLLDYGKTKTRSLQIMKLRHNSLKSRIIQILGILSIFRLSRKNR